MTRNLLIVFLMTIAYDLFAQPSKEYMPSGISPEQQWWNLVHYDIEIRPDYKTKTIEGVNNITFLALRAGSTMQIDLFEPMKITRVRWLDQEIPFSRKGNKYFLHFKKDISSGTKMAVAIYFQGKPREAVNPPWDSGWIWSTDTLGRPWISIACEGTGGAIWLPCKNAGYDEPDLGVDFSITVPDTLVAIANGRLREKKPGASAATTTYTWSVTSPINNYNIVPYIGKYVSWHEDYQGLVGKLDCDYWVLDYNLGRAKEHFKQVDTMLSCFEFWLGPYPFYEDSYKLVEAPFLGMEHQSAIAYGNGFRNGYLNGNLSGTRWGLQWDFILVHESGHEWFGNSITAGNPGESWIHEGFTKYLETIYTSYSFGNEAGNDYSIGIWKRIKNDQPVLGSSSSDAYNKGSALLHMIRQIVGDSVFRGMLRSLSTTFRHRTVSTRQVLDHMNHYCKYDFTPMFEQFLETTSMPILEYYFENNSCYFRWSDCVKRFNMPLKISFGEHPGFFIYPTPAWQQIKCGKNDAASFTVDRNYYIGLRRYR